MDIHRLKSKQPVNWYRPPTNRFCPYCGRSVGPDSRVPSDREHLVGRNFVPAGSFDDGRAFNFIFRACRDDNLFKSRLEGHVSAVSLLQTEDRDADEDLDRLAQRKAAKEVHPETNLPVNDSFGNTRITLRGPISISMNFVSAPQPLDRWVRYLAAMQVQALFALVTNPDPSSNSPPVVVGPDAFRFLGHYFRRDWGNEQIGEVAKRVRSWSTKAWIRTAGGFFKAVLKRDDAVTGEWFWALEWNRSLRVVGALVRGSDAARLLRDLPELPWREVGSNGTGAHLRMRQERALDPKDDRLFDEEDCPE